MPRIYVPSQRTAPRPLPRTAPAPSRETSLMARFCRRVAHRLTSRRRGAGRAPADTPATRRELHESSGGRYVLFVNDPEA
jgi:hypothetical protein